MPDVEPPPDAPDSPRRPTRQAPANWSEQGIGQRWQHRFFYWLIKLGGKQRGYNMARLVSLWYVLNPAIRRRCRFYLDRRFPDRRSVWHRFLDDYRLVRTYSTSLVDRMILSVLGPGAMTAVSPDHDRLTQLASGARGFVLLHAHVGCWQVGMTTLGAFPKRVSIVKVPDPVPTPLLAADKAGEIDPRTGMQSAIEMADALLRGEIVAMMGDRAFGSDRNVVPARFLGDLISLPITPYRLASAAGAPVLVMVAPRIGKGAYAMRLARVIEVPPNLGRQARHYAPYAQMFADCLEEFVREHPWQFYNFYDLWHDGTAGH